MVHAVVGMMHAVVHTMVAVVTHVLGACHFRQGEAADKECDYCFGQQFHKMVCF